MTFSNSRVHVQSGCENREEIFHLFQTFLINPLIPKQLHLSISHTVLCNLACADNLSSQIHWLLWHVILTVHESHYTAVFLSFLRHCYIIILTFWVWPFWATMIQSESIYCFYFYLWSFIFLLFIISISINMLQYGKLLYGIQGITFDWAVPTMLTQKDCMQNYIFSYVYVEFITFDDLHNGDKFLWSTYVTLNVFGKNLSLYD